MKSISFNLKSSLNNNYIPYIYGNLPELGDSDITMAIKMNALDLNQWNLKINSYIPSNYFWYKYLLKTPIGAIKIESIPNRNIENHEEEIEFFDVFEKIPQIDRILIKFRVFYRTYFGQEVYIYGNINELGYFKEENALKMDYNGNCDTWITEISLPLEKNSRLIRFKYFITSPNKEIIYEKGNSHFIEIPYCNSPTLFEVTDCFRWDDMIQEPLLKNPFNQIFNKRILNSEKLIYHSNNILNTIKIQFSIFSPVPNHNQFLILTGSIPELGLWNPNNGIKLNDNQFPMWSTILLLSKNSIPFEYKYVLMDNYGNIKWESRENRLLSSINSSNIDYSFPISLYCNDWMPSLYLNPFKGTGIYIKLFKINTEKSIGCGQIGDICQLIDLCKLTGISLIELSNINDSLGFDSNIISSFAINPIYIDLNNII